MLQRIVINIKDHSPHVGVVLEFSFDFDGDQAARRNGDGNHLVTVVAVSTRPN